MPGTGIYTKNNRFAGVKRNYTSDTVRQIRGSFVPDCTLAKRGAEKLWNFVTQGGDTYINALGTITGQQAVQAAKAGLKAIYLSGWQVAADNNTANETYPDLSLYPYNSVPKVAEKINNSLIRADQIDRTTGKGGQTDYFLPIIADAEAGFGGALNAFELTKSMIKAGAAAVHFEDQLASEKKCGHMGGKVLIPTRQFIRTLNAARLAADALGTSTLIIGRTDANAATLVTSDIDPNDRPFLTGERTPEGFYRSRAGLDQAISRALAYAPYCDLLWCETSSPNIAEARRFASAVHAKFPGKPLAYNCSPSFNWKANLSDSEIASFQKELGKLGYRFQFVTLAGFHCLNHAMFTLAQDYRDNGMAAYVKLQQREFADEKNGFTAHKHQREVGTSYFDMISTATAGGRSSTGAMQGSTEEEQFKSKL